MRASPRFIVFSAVLALCATLLPFGGARDAGAQPASPMVPGEVLVKFRPGTPGQAVADAHRAEQAQVRSRIGRIDVEVVRVPPGREMAAAAAYERNPNVLFAEPNRLYEAITHGETYPQDPQFHQQWQYRNTGQTGGTADADIDAYEAWNAAGIKGSSSINVAILDTGVDPSHEDLAIARTRNFTDSSTTDDRYGHGTHVAGSVAARTNNDKGVSGTCPDCSLWSYKVLNDRGSGQWDWIAAGIVAAADDGAHVINLSLGGYTPSQTLEFAVNYAWNPSAENPAKQNAVVAAAAGNDGQNWGLYPAAYEKSIAVGASDHRDARASFSNYGGNWVDVAAPGASILSTAPRGRTSIWRSGTNGYGALNGTSMATPHVAGLAGLIWSSGKCGPQDNGCVRQRIEGTAEDTAGTGGGFNDFTKNGRINAAAALDVTSTSTPELTPTPTSTPTPGSTQTPTSTPTPTATPTPGLTLTPTSTPTPSTALTVAGISPNSISARSSNVPVTISGAGFQSGAAVTFENGSGNTPTASNVSVAANGQTITAQVSVGSGGPPRPRVWDVRVTNPGGSSAVLRQAFTVNP